MTMRCEHGIEIKKRGPTFWAGIPGRCRCCKQLYEPGNIYSGGKLERWPDDLCRDCGAEPTISELKG